MVKSTKRSLLRRFKDTMAKGSKGETSTSSTSLFSFDFTPFGQTPQTQSLSEHQQSSRFNPASASNSPPQKAISWQPGHFREPSNSAMSSSSSSENSIEESDDEDSTEEHLTSTSPYNSSLALQLQSVLQTVGMEPAHSQNSTEARKHLDLLQEVTKLQDIHEVASTPVFTSLVLDTFPQSFSQYGFFAGITEKLEKPLPPAPKPILSRDDPRLFFNIAAPSSVFICGSQGSGKSHTLSCLLENCLMHSDVSKLNHPLAGLVFHYDTFNSDRQGTPCEAAHLSSNPAIKVRVLCSPTNKHTIKRTYEKFQNIEVEPLRINQEDLNTKRMMDLMAVNTEDGTMPLYLHKITQILRDLRIVQQETESAFNYSAFKLQLVDTTMTPAQLAPLNQRLDTLESFMPKLQTMQAKTRKERDAANRDRGNDWPVKPGTLTIVDLSCPCVTAADACALFNICLSLFLEQKTVTGRVVALDEAHKYMNSSSACEALTSTLLTSVRLQRHLGTRVFISTQEPTVSPDLLDLCSITLVHRFSSPAWLATLKSHLAGLSQEITVSSKNKPKAAAVFEDIVNLRVGEALLFSPSAILNLNMMNGMNTQMIKLGTEYVKIKVRARITQDGGKSVMAT